MNTGCRCSTAPLPAPRREAAVHQLLRERWSPRKFQERDLDGNTVDTLFEAARTAPSSFNDQPWSFILADRRDKEAFSRMLGVLTERNREWASRAPLLVLTLARTSSRRNGAVNPFALHDLGHAVGNLTLQAVAGGLQVHQMGGFDREAARTAFRVPAEYQPVAVVAVGYPAEEQPARNRTPLSSFLFAGEWGRPVSLTEFPTKPLTPHTEEK